MREGADQFPDFFCAFVKVILLLPSLSESVADERGKRQRSLPVREGVGTLPGKTEGFIEEREVGIFFHFLIIKRK